MQEFSPTCTNKKAIKNKPVNAITSFLPTAEVKKYDHFIFQTEGVEKFDAKVREDR